MGKDIILNGKWYIPQTDELLSGSLTINKENKVIAVQLTALASEDEPIPNIKAHGKTDIIKGEISTGGKIVLYDCSFGGPHTAVGRRTDVVVTAKYAFWNLEIEKKDELSFSKIFIDFGEIIGWTELCYLDWDFQGAVYEQRLKWVKKEDVVFQIRDGVTLEISPRLGGQSCHVTTKEMKVQQKIIMKLKYSEEQKWEVISEDINTLNSLLSLAMNKAIYIEELYYEHKSNMDEEMGFIREMEMFIGDFRKGKHKAGQWWENLFQLRDLTSYDNLCFKNWYLKYEKLQPVVDLYASSYNFRGISREMLFLNLAQALETYHARFVSDNFKDYEEIVNKKVREIFSIPDNMDITGDAARIKAIMIAQDKKGKIVLKSRLGYLFLGDLKINFEFLSYGMEEFIQRTLDSRNYYTHYSMNKKDRVFPKEELAYVNGILIGVLQYYIMKEIGIEEKKIIEKVQETMQNVANTYFLNK